MNQNIIDGIKNVHAEKFGGAYIVGRAPGRINLIGEHTDYNEGFVLPAAIDKAIYLSVGKRDDDNISLFSVEYDQSYKTSLEDELQPVPSHWSNYILGVVDQLLKKGYTISGFNLVIDGDIPVGAGLSSSAAVECATAVAMNRLFNLNISQAEITTLAQKAEHEFAGVMCGIMDQFASTFGKKDHVIRLDCRSMEYVYEPLDLKDFRLVLFNTNVKHSLASSAYNQRREECAQGVNIIRNSGTPLNSLRDATLEMLSKYVKPVDSVVYKRCRYVVEENNRLLQACKALEAGDLKALGTLMFKTHQGLSKDFEVSCPELDFLVENVIKMSSVVGARMMGGGFGGCTLNLVHRAEIDTLANDLAIKYRKEMNKELTTIVIETADGAAVIDR